MSRVADCEVVVAGGGPVGSTHIWITHIYEFAFQRQQWGRGSAYAVLLFIIMVVLGTLIGGMVVAMYLPIFKLGSVV